MKTTQEQRFCQNCDEIMPCTKKVPNHVLHLLLTLFTGGLWTFIWLPVTLFAMNSKFSCIKCNREIHDKKTAHTSPKYPENSHIKKFWQS